MEINSKPTVIDFDSILVPISDENPSGELLSYSGIYDEIREARRADIDAAQGDWQRELKVADFAQVINLAVPALTSQSKDLQIGVWLAEALTKQHGFVGLRDALRLVSELQNRFWETLHPEIDEGDMEGRANAIEWLDKQCTQAAREAAISGGEGVSFLGFEDSKIFDIPENFDSLDSDKQAKLNELKDQAEQENRVTGERWRKAKNASRRQFYEELNLTLEECWTSVGELDSSIEANYDRNQMPSLTNLKKSLDTIRDLVKKILQEKRLEEPTEEELNAGIEESEDGLESDGSEASLGTSSGISGTSGPIKSRQDALKRLSEIAEYFRKTEPHSPVASLVQRSVKWGNMPLDTLLQELVKDQTVLDQIRETLGMAVNADQSGSEYAETTSENTW